MGKFKDLVAEQSRVPKIDKDQLGGWESLAAAYRELDPDVTTPLFVPEYCRARVLSRRVRW